MGTALTRGLIFEFSFFFGYHVRGSGAVAGGGGPGGAMPPPPEKILSDNFDTCRKFLSSYLRNLKNVLSTNIRCCRKFISCYKCVKLQETVCNIKVSGVVAGGRPIGKFYHFLPFVGKTIN